MTRCSTPTMCLASIRRGRFLPIYQSSGGETKVKHLIEPFVNYRYDSPVSESDRIITAHGFYRYHQITYGLTNRILVKKDMRARSSPGG